MYSYTTPKPVPSNKVCADATVLSTNLIISCALACIQMIAARYGLHPSNDWIVAHAGTNAQNGTGHSGVRQAFHDLGFNY
jgi:ABC-type bacteriocin/lantibiotic exporter with double-glycine peptidase domain